MIPYAELASLEVPGLVSGVLVRGVWLYHFSRPYFSMHHSCHELSVFCHTT